MATKTQRLLFTRAFVLITHFAVPRFSPELRHEALELILRVPHGQRSLRRSAGRQRPCGCGLETEKQLATSGSGVSGAARLSSENPIQTFFQTPVFPADLSRGRNVAEPRLSRPSRAPGREAAGDERPGEAAEEDKRSGEAAEDERPGASMIITTPDAQSKEILWIDAGARDLQGVGIERKRPACQGRAGRQPPRLRPLSEGKEKPSADPQDGEKSPAIPFHARFPSHNTLPFPCSENPKQGTRVLFPGRRQQSQTSGSYTGFRAGSTQKGRLHGSGTA